MINSYFIPRPLMDYTTRNGVNVQLSLQMFPCEAFGRNTRVRGLRRAKEILKFHTYVYVHTRRLKSAVLQQFFLSGKRSVQLPSVRNLHDRTCERGIARIRERVPIKMRPARFSRRPILSPAIAERDNSVVSLATRADILLMITRVTMSR